MILVLVSCTSVCVPECDALRVAAAESVGGDHLHLAGRCRGACREIEIRRAWALDFGDFPPGGLQRVDVCGIIGVVERRTLHGAAVTAVLIPYDRPVRIPVPHLCHDAGRVLGHLAGVPYADLPCRGLAQAPVFPREFPAAFAEQLEALGRTVPVDRIPPEVAADLRYVVLRDPPRGCRNSS